MQNQNFLTLPGRQLQIEYAASSDRAEHPADDDWNYRAEELLVAVRRRQGVQASEDGCFPEVASDFNTRYVLDTASLRYFELHRLELEKLQRVFNAEEFEIILNAVGAPICKWGDWVSLSEMVSWDHGCDIFDEETLLFHFARRLSTLTAAQNLALVDVCERIWREPRSGGDSLETIAARCGLKLA